MFRAAPLLLFFCITACCKVSILSPHGSRMDVDGQMRTAQHAGVDFGAAEGSPVLAAADGEVVAITVSQVGCGIGVLLAHEDFNRFTVYCHMKLATVDLHQTVQRGQQLGFVGTTGSANGVPHVHLELCTTACSFGHADGFIAQTEDPLPASDGFFDARKTYPRDRLVLTYPVLCGASRRHRKLRVAVGRNKTYVGSKQFVSMRGIGAAPCGLRSGARPFGASAH